VGETGIGSGRRPGHGIGLFNRSANIAQSARCAEVIGTSGTPSTTSDFGHDAIGAVACLRLDAPPIGDEGDEHAAIEVPVMTASTPNHIVRTE
jgi:hypothetical protein